MSNLIPKSINVMEEMARLDFENLRQEVADRLKFQVEFAQAAMKNLTLVNGGAIVALFTILGHDGGHFEMHRLWWAFVCFSLGLVFVLGAFLAAFYSQLFFMNSSAYQMWNSQLQIMGEPAKYEIIPEFKKGNRALAVGVSLALLSLVAFVTGAGFALAGAQ